MENENNLSVQEENRFKVVEIEKYNAEMDALNRSMIYNSIGLGAGVLGASLAIIMGMVNFNEVNSFLPLIFGCAGLNLVTSFKCIKNMLKVLFNKVRIQQKIEDIDFNVEMYIDNRINEILDYVKVEAEKKLQEQIEMKQDLTNNESLKDGGISR